MTVVPKNYCWGEKFCTHLCDPKNNNCDIQCKYQYRSVNATGDCEKDEGDLNICVCHYCGSQLSYSLKKRCK